MFIDSIAADEDLDLTISRAKFEEISVGIFQRCLVAVDDVLTAANVNKPEVDDIVLVGGTSRIPRVQKMLEDYFNKKLTFRVNPDEAVALGATILAAQLQGEIPEAD